ALLGGLGDGLGRDRFGQRGWLLRAGRRAAPAEQRRQQGKLRGTGQDQRRRHQIRNRAKQYRLRKSASPSGPSRRWKRSEKPRSTFCVTSNKMPPSSGGAKGSKNSSSGP